MASIMLLWDRVTSYFAKRDKAVLNDESELQQECNMIDIVLNICSACNRNIPNQYFNVEHQMCNCCLEISFG